MNVEALLLEQPELEPDEQRRIVGDRREPDLDLLQRGAGPRRRGSYAARDAIDLVEVDYEPLPAVVDPEKAIAKGATLLYDQFSDNIAYRWQELEGGEVDKAFKAADKIVKQRMVNQRLIPVAMETRGVVADYKVGEKQLTVVSNPKPLICCGRRFPRC